MNRDNRAVISLIRKIILLACALFHAMVQGVLIGANLKALMITGAPTAAMYMAFRIIFISLPIAGAILAFLNKKKIAAWLFFGLYPFTILTSIIMVPLHGMSLVYALVTTLMYLLPGIFILISMLMKKDSLVLCILATAGALLMSIGYDVIRIVGTGGLRGFGRVILLGIAVTLLTAAISWYVNPDVIIGPDSAGAYSERKGMREQYTEAVYPQQPVQSQQVQPQEAPAGFCTQCGRPLRAADLFCGGCGAKRG